MDERACQDTWEAKCVLTEEWREPKGGAACTYPCRVQHADVGGVLVELGVVEPGRVGLKLGWPMQPSWQYSAIRLNGISNVFTMFVCGEFVHLEVRLHTN